MTQKNKKKWLVAGGATLLILLMIVGGVVLARGKNDDQPQANVTPTRIPEPVNVIPVSERPYVTLEPLVGRNELGLMIDELKKPAEELELVLEYDRNKGVLDAVLRTFLLSKLPLEDTVFLGSKSAGGHTTYHDDVIGGTLHFEFDGENPYALETPWRYSDTEESYQELSTADGRFQVELEDEFVTSKVVVMQSPGYPGDLDGEVIAGPYLFRGVGDLPDSNLNVKIRLAEEAIDTIKLWGFDGSEWQEIEAEVSGKEISASTQVYEVYVVTK